MPRKMRRGSKRHMVSMREISLTPLIDTALTLLIIFMITAPMMQNSIMVNLPKGDARENESINKHMIVSVDKNDRIYLNSIPTTLKNLVDLVKKRVGANPDKAVYVEADEDINYGKVIDIVDKLKVVGEIDNVVLVTEKRA